MQWAKTPIDRSRPGQAKLVDPAAEALISTSWRERMKSGPLCDLYALLRMGKRRLFGAPLAGYVPQTHRTLTVNELLQLAPQMPDHGRVYYSLGLAYLARGLPGDALKAAACLRSADTLGFESPERVALHLAWLASRLGAASEAAGLLVRIEQGELTPNEQSLLEQILEKQAAGDAPLPTHGTWQGVREAVESAGPVTSLLALGDDEAVSATWWPDARYLSATPVVTGLTPESVGRMCVAFDVAVGPVGALACAKLARVRCARWHVVAPAPGSA